MDEQQQEGLEPGQVEPGDTDDQEQPQEPEQAGADPAEDAAQQAPGAKRRRPCLAARARRRDVRRQWERGVEGGGLFVLGRTIPENPDAVDLVGLLPGVGRRQWRRAGEAWAGADLAMSQTALGLLLSARVVLVPDGGRFWAATELPGIGVIDDLTGPYKDPGRCLLAARARLAADVVREAPLLADVRDMGLDCRQARVMLLGLLEEAGLEIDRDAEPGA